MRARKRGKERVLDEARRRLAAHCATALARISQLRSQGQQRTAVSGAREAREERRKVEASIDQPRGGLVRCERASVKCARALAPQMPGHRGLRAGLKHWVVRSREV